MQLKHIENSDNNNKENIPPNNGVQHVHNSNSNNLA